jgi:uncharacterized membrane protein YjjB (DUF3815 family)
MNQYYNFLFVPAFTLCLCIINQAKWKQMPVMLGIACVGYVVNFFSAKKFPSNAQISNTLGALAIGVLGNLYSRLRHGVAAAALLPAIFVQVPSGLAASGSLLSGLYSADQITSSATYANGTSKVNGTAGSVRVALFCHYSYDICYSLLCVPHLEAFDIFALPGSYALFVKGTQVTHGYQKRSVVYVEIQNIY